MVEEVVVLRFSVVLGLLWLMPGFSTRERRFCDPFWLLVLRTGRRVGLEFGFIVFVAVFFVTGLCGKETWPVDNIWARNQDYTEVEPLVR